MRRRHARRRDSRKPLVRGEVTIYAFETSRDPVGGVSAGWVDGGLLIRAVNQGAGAEVRLPAQEAFKLASRLMLAHLAHLALTSSSEPAPPPGKEVGS